MRELALTLAAGLDPVAFALSVGLDADPWQAEVLRSPARRMLLNCSRQSGKSTTASVKALHRAVFYPSSLILLVSPSLRQSGELFRKIGDQIERLPTRPRMKEDNRLSLVLDNGSRIVSLPGSEATIRGFSRVDLLIEDEAARCDDALYRSVRPMLAVSGGALILMSTPFGRRGHFFEEWHSQNDWKRVEISATLVPRISPEFLAEERRSLGEWWFAQEYCCQFRDTVDSLFRSEDIARAITPDVAPLFAEASAPALPPGVSAAVRPLFAANERNAR
jgi:hypothetical protein